METMDALKLRRSARAYVEKSVEKQKLDKLVDVANHAPNSGPFQITIIENIEILKQINDETLVAMKNSGNNFLMSRAALEGYQPLYGAPVMILLSAPPGGYAQVNVACAATNITIAAADMELGSCYVVAPMLVLNGKNELSKKMGILEGYVPMCGVLIGYATTDKFSKERLVVDNVNYIS